MNKTVYDKYLNSSTWKRKRVEKAVEQNFKCEICRKVVKVGYHIHHKTYKNFMNEPLSDLQFLCEDCHLLIHCKNYKPNKTKKVFKHKHKNKIRKEQWCKYSSVMCYKGATKKYVLWCNKNYCECVSVCRSFKKGRLTTSPNIKICL